MVSHLDANMICVCVITTITIKIIPLRIDTKKYRLRHSIFSSNTYENNKVNKWSVISTPINEYVMCITMIN